LRIFIRVNLSNCTVLEFTGFCLHSSLTAYKSYLNLLYKKAPTQKCSTRKQFLTVLEIRLKSSLMILP